MYAVDIGRLAHHQAAVVDANVVDADVVTHDEQDVGLVTLRPCRALDDHKSHQGS
jgi:hypothetical protein